MSKYVDKVEQYKHKILDPALIKLQAEYDEAVENYRDSGYDRYFNKMRKYEEEIKAINEYLAPGKQTEHDITSDQYREYKHLKHTMSIIKSKVFYLIADLPDCTEKIGLKDVLRDIEDYQEKGE